MDPVGAQMQTRSYCVGKSGNLAKDERNSDPTATPLYALLNQKKIMHCNGIHVLRPSINNGEFGINTF